MTITNNQVKIALFFGGKISRHLVLIKKAAKKMGVRLDLVSYNRVCFDTEEMKVKIRGNIEGTIETKVKNEGWLEINDYDVLFFRTTGKHWEEVNLIVHQVESLSSCKVNKKPVIIDPLVLKGKPSFACKAHQMLALKRAGIAVPKTVYGSLWWLYEYMKSSQKAFCGAHALRSGRGARMIALRKSLVAPILDFPIILKGSGGDRGTRVFRAENLEELEKLVKKLRKTEIEEGRRYMLQEFIENEGDYRVLVLGKKVLGVMKRSRQKEGEFRNNFSLGGRVEIADLPEEVKQMAVKAAEVCGLWVAGVDIIHDSRFKIHDSRRYMVLEVNKGPQFKGFMEATGIDVPREIVQFLASLKVES